jgi:ribosomal protein S18 acetylase RimI-like enzyme
MALSCSLSDRRLRKRPDLSIRELQSREDRLKCFEVLQELRPTLTWTQFICVSSVAAARDEFALAGLFEGDACVGVIGYRVLYDFVHGKHLYIDDLVVTHRLRSKGAGAMMLAYAERRARELGCDGLRLCTGIENTSAISFYERQGWKAGSIAFKKR